jgi:hypothetical protein
MHLINQLLDDFVRIKSLLLYFGDGLVGVVKTASAGPKSNGMEADEDLTEPGPRSWCVGGTRPEIGNVLHCRTWNLSRVVGCKLDGETVSVFPASGVLYPLPWVSVASLETRSLG